MEEKTTIQKYNDFCNVVEQRMNQISSMMETGHSLVQQLNPIMDSFVQLKREQQQLDAQLKVVQETLRNNLEKFKEIVRGAEKRLDRQLDTIDRWTEMLLMRDLGTLDINEMNAQQTILEAIQMANDRFNNELDKLYSL
jgi:N12 class adenine-specific DNA methylase